jgi:hypothetical protein
MTTCDSSWEPLSPVIRLSQSETHHDYAKTTASPDSEYFDISAAWYNHPEPYTTPPVVPISKPSRHHVPELSHHYSTSSSSSIVEGVPTHCSSCGLISSPVELLAENRFSHICADISREQECPDTHTPSLAERRASISRNSPTYNRRRHSSLYEPASQEPALHFELLELKSKSDEQESKPEHLEYNALERESSSPTKQKSHPSDELNNTHFYAQSLTSLITSAEQKPKQTKQEPHHIHDKGTDFYAHTLTSLVSPVEQDYSPIEQYSDPFEDDTDAGKEASPPDHPYHQNPAARLSLERSKQEDWKRHCRAQRAQRQLRFGTAWVSPAKISDLYADEMEEERTRHGHRSGEPDSGPMREQYYGKCI